MLDKVDASVFDWSVPASYQVYENHLWIPQIGITWSLGVSALGLVMILLAISLVPLVLLFRSGVCRSLLSVVHQLVELLRLELLM